MKQFLMEVGGYNTTKIKYRPRAQYTNPFGLTRRYRTVNGKAEWGWPGVHYGVDRSIGPYGAREIYAPVSGLSRFEDWKGEVYGSLIFLNHWADFCVVIAHCAPDDVVEDVREGGGIDAGTFIAYAGDYGFSFGIHTHTEIRADGAGCRVLDDFCRCKFGEDPFRDMPESEVIAEYGRCECTRMMTRPEILKDYAQLRDEKNVELMNKYRIVRQVKGGHRTYYSSQLVLEF